MCKKIPKIEVPAQTPTTGQASADNAALGDRSAKVTRSQLIKLPRFKTKSDTLPGIDDSSVNEAVASRYGFN